MKNRNLESRIANQRKELARLNKKIQELKNGETYLSDEEMKSADEVMPGIEPVFMKWGTKWEAPISASDLLAIPHFVSDLDKGIVDKFRKEAERMSKLINEQEKRDKANYQVIFTNCFGEKFTEGWLTTHRVYWVAKGTLEIHSKIGSMSMIFGEDGILSDIFKSESSAKKWIEQYKAKRLAEGYIFDKDDKEFRPLKFSEVCYKAKTVQDLFDVFRSVPREMLSYTADMNITEYPYIVNYSNGKIGNYSFNYGDCTLVSKQVFISIIRKESKK
ncbi:MAG: hypothetical protein M0P15_04320 [Bacteroides sp.]|nr:hypothetical protein [Bacteroides sp.]